MSVSRRGMARAVLTTAAGAGLVAVAMQVPGAVAVGPAKAGDLSVAGTTSAVRGAQLVCPGPERLGTEGIDDVPTMKVNGTRRPKAATVSDWRVL